MTRRFLELAPFFWVIGCAYDKEIEPTVSPSQTASEYDSVDVQIRFWEERLPRDPENDTVPRLLGAAYLRKARGSGDFSFYIKAEKVLTPLLQRERDNYGTLILLASAKAAQHKFREAVELAEQARSLHPEEASAYALLFDAKLELGDLRSAEQVLALLTEIGPCFASSTRSANLSLVRGDESAAMSSLEAALDESKSYSLSAEDIAWCHVRIGGIHFDHGRWDQAEMRYLAALEVLPQGYLPLEHLAELRAAQGRYGEALQLFDRVIDLAPAPEFFEAIGKIYRSKNEVEKAEKWFKQAEEAALRRLREGDIGCYRYLARFYSDVRPNPSQALKFARADLKVREDVHSYDTLAWALFRSGSNSEAAMAMGKALAAGTNDAQIFHHAAIIYAALPDVPRAKLYARKTLETNSRFSASTESHEIRR